MIFTPTRVPGAYLIVPERIDDERGFFARTWCPEELAAHGLNPHLAQISRSYNHSRGTLRGMHYQIAPHEEAKLVSCTQGAIYDVAVDLRPVSPTYRQWIAARLTAHGMESLYVPEGCAHGFVTLEENTVVQYFISAPYRRDSARGVRWDDPALGIEWPVRPVVINDRDRTFPLIGAA